MNPINPKSLNLLHLPFVRLSIWRHNHFRSILAFLSRSLQSELLLHLPEVASDEGFNVPLHRDLSSLLLQLHVVKLPQLSFNENGRISPWIGFLRQILRLQFSQGNLSGCAQRGIVVQSMWVLTHVVAKSTSASVIVEVVVAVKLVERLVVKSTTTIIVVERAIVEVVVIL